MREIYKVDLPYPSLDNIKPDGISAKIISPAYSGQESELTAVMQYMYHHFYFEDIDEEIASGLIKISLAEMEHFEILGKLLLKLGVDPVYTWCPPLKWNFYNTSGVSYTKTPQKMLMDDITGELLAIKEYEKMLSCLRSEEVSAVISRIILDEQLHVKILKEYLEKINKNTQKECFMPKNT